MFFPIFDAHRCGAEFQYPDRSWKETCGMMANFVAKSGALSVNNPALSRNKAGLLSIKGGFSPSFLLSAGRRCG